MLPLTITRTTKALDIQQPRRQIRAFGLYLPRFVETFNKDLKHCPNLFPSRVHCLDCLASLFKSDDTTNKNTLELIHILYKKLDTNPLQMLLHILKQPFTNVRKSCFKIFYNLVTYEWMLSDVKNIPGKYLLNSSLSGRTMKWKKI